MQPVVQELGVEVDTMLPECITAELHRANGYFSGKREIAPDDIGLEEMRGEANGKVFPSMVANL